MATFSRHILSGSTNGAAIPILGATTSGGQLIHTAQTPTGGSDEIWVYAVQYGTTSGQSLYYRHGGVSGVDTIQIAMTPNTGPIPIIPGFLLNNALEARAFCTTSNEIAVYGWVNRVAT